jgi:acylphosphatase
MIRRRLLISGDVQGVGFRWSCERMAQKEGLAGWCRNLDDGRVEACFEGEDSAVERAVDWCWHGPSSADVTDIEVISEPPQGEARFDSC